MQKNITFKQGEEKREELELPTLHFIVMDQWLDVIGERALLSWLKFYTWCDRDRNKGDKPDHINLWEQSKVPYSFKQMIKKLGVGRDTFYNKIIKPLWNVGLIDIEEYEDSKNTGQKPMNIIVYKYPQNNKSLSFNKIEEVRNYDTDYSSTAKSFAVKGGRPRKDINNNENTSEMPKEDVNKPNLEKDSDSENRGGSLSEQGGVLSQNRGGSLSEQGGFSLRTGGGSEIGDNNNLNPITNSFNLLNNDFNNLNNKLNPNPITNAIETLWNTNLPHDLKTRIKIKIYNQELFLTSEQILLLEDAYNFQIEKGYIIPDCSKIDRSGINDYEFSLTIIKMLETVQEKIDNMKGLVQTWVLKAYEFKITNLYESPTKSLPNYNWLETENENSQAQNEDEEMPY